jgi:hypothetical protein
VDTVRVTLEQPQSSKAIAAKAILLPTLEAFEYMFFCPHIEIEAGDLGLYATRLYDMRRPSSSRNIIT